MKKSDRLGKLVDVQRNMESAALPSYSNALSEYMQQSDQLEQLRIYRDEYKDRLEDRLNAPIPPGELNDFRFFFSSLEETIKKQEAVVNDLLAVLEHSRNIWIEKRNDVKKMTKLKEKAELMESNLLQKQENLQMDELNQMMHVYYGDRHAH